MGLNISLGNLKKRGRYYYAEPVRSLQSSGGKVKLDTLFPEWVRIAVNNTERYMDIYVWLSEQDFYCWRLNQRLTENECVVLFSNKDDASLFKLTWG